jgi:putative lipoic acid-binding regulatory protein
MTKKYIIKIHSFVDLITNSSTEIYVAAGEHTVKAVKEIINNILLIGGSKLIADDLFEISLSNSDVGEYSSVELNVKAKDQKSPDALTAAKLLSDLTGLFSIEAQYNG